MHWGVEKWQTNLEKNHRQGTPRTTLFPESVPFQQVVILTFTYFPADKALHAMTLLVEQPHSFLQLKQELLVWNWQTRRASWRHCPANSHTCRRAESLCTHWLCGLYSEEDAACLAHRPTSVWDFGDGKSATSCHRVRPFSHPACKCLYHKKTSRNKCFICFKILFQSKFSTISNEKTRTFLNF